MKQVLIVLSILVMAFSKSVAADPSVSNEVMKSFQAAFATAKEVSWSQADGFYVVSFQLNGKKKYAYYNQSAELVVVAEPINIHQLTDELQADIIQRFTNAHLRELYKMKDSSGIRYYAVLETEKDKIIVNAIDDVWKVAKRTRK